MEHTPRLAGAAMGRRVRLKAGLVVLLILGACGDTAVAPTTTAGNPSATTTTTTTLPATTTTSPPPVTTTTSRTTTSAAESTTTSVVTVSPSQSAEDAARDGIIPELAALPTDLRSTVLPEDFGTTRIEADEGVWLISQPSPDIPGLESGCLIGDTSGLYGREFVCTFEYAELLLLDSDTRAILRAYPFHSVPPRSMIITDDAVYCIRQGDGALPDSMLCRIDRAALEPTVRVFPSALDSGFNPDNEQFVPSYWTIDEPVAAVLWQQAEMTDGRLVFSGHSGSAAVDPVTLEILEVMLNE